MEKIVLIQERTAMGITKPFICQTDKGQWVILKTRSMMPIKQLLAELIGSELARQLGLPCPCYRFTKLTAETIAYLPAEWQLALIKGTAFCSDFVPQAKLAKTVQAKQQHSFDRFQLQYINWNDDDELIKFAKIL